MCVGVSVAVTLVVRVIWVVLMVVCVLGSCGCAADGVAAVRVVLHRCCRGRREASQCVTVPVRSEGCGGRPMVALGVVRVLWWVRRVGVVSVAVLWCGGVARALRRGGAALFGGRGLLVVVGAPAVV